MTRAPHKTPGLVVQTPAVVSRRPVPGPTAKPAGSSNEPAAGAAATDPAALGALEQEIKHLIVDALMLEDVRPEEIDADGSLFGEGGLGLDSIDVLELAMALHKRYGVKTRADDAQNREIFSNVRNLAAFVAAERNGGAA